MAAAMTAKAPLKKQTDAVAASTVGAGGPLSAPPTLTQQDDALSRLPPDITSPHELTDWVDAVLDRLESRFQSANQQYEMRSELGHHTLLYRVDTDRTPHLSARDVG
jgi:hypothetical protein